MSSQHGTLRMPLGDRLAVVKGLSFHLRSVGGLEKVGARCTLAKRSYTLTCCKSKALSSYTLMYFKLYPSRWNHLRLAKGLRVRVCSEGRGMSCRHGR